MTVAPAARSAPRTVARSRAAPQARLFAVAVGAVGAAVVGVVLVDSRENVAGNDVVVVNDIVVASDVIVADVIVVVADVSVRVF